MQVVAELSADGVPPQVAAWIRNKPDWIDAREASPGCDSHPQVEDLDSDAGEKAVIELALAERDALLLIDEASGRAVVTRLGIPNTGTLGVLVARAGLIDLEAALARLQPTHLRVSNSLVTHLLAENAPPADS